MTQQFTDEEAVRKFKLDIPVRVYGNWFTEVGDADCPRSPFIYVVCNQIRDSVLASMRYAREQLINHQAKQIKQVQDSFPVTAKEKIYKFKFERRIDLYNPRNFTADLMPSFIFPEQDGNPVLPNLVFGYDSVPIEMLTAQALEIGYIELRYNIDAIANTFNVKICLVANGNSAESCINSYSIKYKNEDSSINFYEGPEAVWWFWVGGECVQQKIVPSPQPRPATNVDEILRQGIRFSLDGGFHDYVNPPLTTRTGVGNLPLSSFTKLTNHTDPSSQLLLQEISKRIASKYQEMRKALNQDLRNELDNPASF